MPDIFTKAKRSEVMSLIRSRGNKDTELRLAKLFRTQGITGWRRHLAIKGKGISEKKKGWSVRPDFVFRTLRVAVFVDGCFWHGCPLHGTKPRRNAAFWKAKLEGNQKRDRLVSRRLRKEGWRVLRIWEHELPLKHETRLMRRIRRVLDLVQVSG